MNRLFALLSALFVVGCGGSTLVLPTAPPGGLPTAPPINFTIPPIVLPSSAGGAAVPSTEKIQIANMYVPGDEPPFGIDVYWMRSSPFGNFGESYPVAGDAPVAHADFGAATAVFDPGNLNDSEAWAAFRAGKPPTEENKVWYFGSGIKEGGRFTVVMSSSDTSGDPAVKHLGVQVGARDETNPIGAEVWSLEPTMGTLILDNEGLDAVWGDTSPNTMFVKIGDKCGDYYPSSPGQPQPALPGGLTAYQNTATGTVPVIAYAHDYRQTADCTGSPQTDPISATIPVGGYGYVFVYSTDGTDLKGFFVPPVH